MNQYRFPAPDRDAGHHWHIRKKVFDLINKKIISVAYYGVFIELGFEETLAGPDLSMLEKLFSKPDSVLTPPSTENTVFLVQDLWETRERFKKETGLDFVFWFSKSSESLERHDVIEMHFNKKLTKDEVLRVKLTYARSMRIRE